MRQKHYVVAYDVADRKRRNKLSKWLLNFAYRVQYSVFEMKVDDLTKEKVVDGIELCLNRKEDSVIIYELDADCWDKKILLGPQTEERDMCEKDFVILG